jgi:single-stranded-DNA-specific exonuclease
MTTTMTSPRPSGGAITAIDPAREALWRFPERNGGDAGAIQLAEALGIPPITARLLWGRGYRDAVTAQKYLEAGLDQLHDPFSLLGMESAVRRIQAALAAGERILLYGDYDVDGTSAIVILKTTLDLLGGRTEYFVPHRLRDGYGMKGDKIEAAAAAGFRLVISVDTGIRAGEVVRLANSLGLDTIVTDHHLPEEEIPPAVAVLNPNQPGCGYPNKNLCGAGVAFKLAQALFQRSGWPPAKQQRVTESLLKMAALATVADIVPLEGENRAIVKQGLEGLREVKNPGLRALLDVSGVRAGTAPTARQVGFQIGPRINAAGRMASASEVIELFLGADAGKAQQIAQALDELNRERQATEEEIRESIFASLEAETRLGLVLFDPAWHLGVAGIVAGRVAEKHRKPVFVLARDEKDGSTTIKGSGRSIPGFHLLDALESMKEIFEQFGGHEQAAGVTLREENLELFRERFAAYAAARLDDAMRQPRMDIEAVVSVPEVDVKLYETLRRFEPFGYRNSAPLLALRDVEVIAPPVLMKGKHIKLTVRQEGRLLNLKGWNLAERYRGIQPGERWDLAFQLEQDSWDGWAATLRALRPAR